MRLSFCVTNTDHRALLRYCLDAIARERATLDVPSEVLVLDNASSDGSPEAAAEHGVRPEVIALAVRRPWADNANVLLRRARGEFCLLLAEAAELEPGATVTLHSAITSDDGAGLAGGSLVRADGSVLPSAWRFLRRPVRARDEFVRRVEVAQCAAALVRREAAEAVGWVPPGRTAKDADAAFCRRLRHAGRRVLYVPAARAVLHEPRDVAARPDRPGAGRGLRS